jgi:hypothetical protein
MAQVRLTDGTIQVHGEWLSAEEIQSRIKEKMDAGDMKFAELASALEELNQTMENAQQIEVRLVLPKADYERLRKRGGEDDNESVRKAILAFIEGSEKKTEVAEDKGPAPETMKPKAAPPPEAPKPKASPPPETPKPKKPPEPQAESEKTVVCTKCKQTVYIPEGAAPSEIECGFCGTSILLEQARPAEGAGSEPPEQPEAADGEPDPSVRHKDHFIG